MKTLKAADLFCGAGGTSSGLMDACSDLGLSVKLTAINHWDVAIATHSANHPGATHMCASLETVNPRELFRKLELMWASPECMHHSVARGGKPINDQSRSTAWHIVQWAEALLPEVILVENVKEFLTWGPIGTNGRPLKRRRGEIFRSWKQCLESLGYRVDYKILRAADFGDPTTRERLFIQAVRGKRRIVWPKPSHASTGKEHADLFRKKLRPWIPAREIIDWQLPSKSIFERKKPLSNKTMRRIWTGLEKFGLKPFIVPGQSEREGQKPRTHDVDKPVPTVTAQGHLGVVEPFLISTDQTGGNGKCVNKVDDPLTTITTKQRHAIVQPFIVRYNGDHKGKTDGDNRVHDVENPLPAIDTSNRYAVAQPFLVRHQGQSGPESVDNPISGLTTKQKHSLVEPYLIKMRGTNIGTGIDTPVPTLTSGGTHIGLAEPFLVQVNRTNGDRVKSLDKTLGAVCGNGEHAIVTPMLLPHTGGGRARPVNEPFPTIMPGSRSMGLIEPFLVQFNTKDRQLGTVDKPLGTVTTKSRFGLVRPIVVIDGEEYVLDIHFRMLQPVELAAAQGFPKGYKFSGNKTEVVKQIGNAVPVNLAKALCKSVLREGIRATKKAA